MNKKVLIITYYWPPSGGPGVQRVLKFVKFLPQFGWDPIVMTVENGEYPAIDESLLQEVPSDVPVYRIRTLEFFNLFRRFTGKNKKTPIETFVLTKKKEELSWKDKIAYFIRLNFFLPDARLAWIWFGFRPGLKIIREVNPDVLFSTSPPQTVQLLARRLAKKTGIPWVADFRDPWTKVFYDKGSPRLFFANKINAWLEQKTIRSADAVVSVSQGFLQLLKADQNAKSTKVITNGFDEEDFTGHRKQNDHFQIIYTGHIAATQVPKLFFSAVSLLVHMEHKDIEVHFYGTFDSQISQLIQEYRLEKIVHFHEYVSHKEVIPIIENADLLLLLIPQNHGKGIIPAKLFEYLGTGNYILGIGSSDDEAGQILKETQTGIMLDFGTNPVGVIRDIWTAWFEKKSKEVDRKKINVYSRKNLTRQLAQLLTEICSGEK